MCYDIIKNGIGGNQAVERYMELNAEEKLLEDAANMAFELLYINDKYLIDKRVSERSIVFRYAHYLQSELEKTNKYRGYNLDCEYNRDGSDLKHIYESDHGVFPDLIIHKRGSNKNNLLIIEFKTYWNNDITNDERKIREFININGRFKYKYGFSVVFNRDYPKVYRITY